MRKTDKRPSKAPARIRAIVAALALSLGGFASAPSVADSPVSGRIGSAALVERGLQSYADGRLDQADDDLAAALQADPTDAKAAEALAALRTSREDAEGAAKPALLLVKYGSPRQAVAAAEFLESMGRDALSPMRARPEALSDAVSAEWISARLVSAGRWAEAKTTARAASRIHPSSWSLLVSLSVAEAMSDRPDDARETLLMAKAAGATDEALRAADSAIRSAKIRESLAAKDAASKKPEKVEDSSERVETPAPRPIPEPVVAPRVVEAVPAPVSLPVVESARPIPNPAPVAREIAPRSEPTEAYDPERVRRTLERAEALLSAARSAEPTKAPKSDDRFSPEKAAPKGDRLF